MDYITAKINTPASVSAPLGTTAKYAAKFDSNYFEFQKKRFELQRVAASILAKDALKKLKKTSKKYVGDIHRTCDCCWSAIAEHVIVAKSMEHGTGHYKNLATCGSVWACPVCAAKIQERRRQEIADAMSAHYEKGGKCVMLTLTAPHYFNQSLGDLREMQKTALSFLRKNGTLKRFLNSFGCLGLIRSLECVYSIKHGWHLHTHELYFVDKSMCPIAFKATVLKAWRAACHRAGFISDDTKKSVLGGFDKHSVDVLDNAKCSDYLAKQDDASHWGADREIAKSTSKQGKKSGLHAFGLLAAIADDDENAAHYERKFVEYANVMKGSRQIFWSHGLKNHFDIGDKSDDECAAENTDSSLIVISEIPNDVWSKIRVDSRAILLEIVARCSKREVDIFINSFKDEPPPPPSPPPQQKFFGLLMSIPQRLIF